MTASPDFNWLKDSKKCRKNEIRDSLSDLVKSLQGTKGQIISKCPFGVFVSTKKPTKRFRP